MTANPRGSSEDREQPRGSEERSGIRGGKLAPETEGVERILLVDRYSLESAAEHESLAERSAVERLAEQHDLLILQSSQPAKTPTAKAQDDKSRRFKRCNDCSSMQLYVLLFGFPLSNPRREQRPQ